METLVADECLAAGPSRRSKQDILDRQLQVLVGRDADRILDVACLQCLVDFRPCEGRVGAERNTRTELTRNPVVAGGAGCGILPRHGRTQEESAAMSTDPTQQLPIDALQIIAPLAQRLDEDRENGGER